MSEIFQVYKSKCSTFNNNFFDFLNYFDGMHLKGSHLALDCTEMKYT